MPTLIMQSIYAQAGASTAFLSTPAVTFLSKKKSQPIADEKSDINTIDTVKEQDSKDQDDENVSEYTDSDPDNDELQELLNETRKDVQLLSINVPHPTYLT
jgi:hypothetical protein